MNYSTAIFLISDTVRAVEGIYENSDNAPRTTFKTFDTSIKIDDYVVVPTETRHKMTVVKIVDVDIDLDVETNEDIKWIVGTVNRESFEDLTAQEEDAIARIKSAQKRKKRQELAAALMADAEEEIKALPIASTGKIAES